MIKAAAATHVATNRTRTRLFEVLSRYVRSLDAKRYAAAILVAFAALYSRELLKPYLGERNAFHTAWLAVVIAAWYFGLGPSILTLVIETLGVWYFFLPPLNSWQLQDATVAGGLVGFVLLSGLIVAFGEVNRRSIARREAAEQELRETQNGLERTVEERTQDLQLEVAERKSTELRLRNSEESLRQLSVRLLRAQDEERRKIARELHDSAGQYLAAVTMALEAVKNDVKDVRPSVTRKLEEASQVTQACIKEVRILSHLLHPPLLDELGLSSAVDYYVEGFAARSGIRVGIERPKDLARLGNDVEILLFRVLQESLTNVHRHSGSKTATIRIGADSQKAWLEVQDQGNGSINAIDGDSSGRFRAGVGITGMRERVRDLGGTAEITADHSGTRVRVVVPLTAESHKTKAEEKAVSETMGNR